MFAVIDIGTNSVLLLAGVSTKGGKVEVTANEARVTRLGEGITSSNFINDGAMERTLAVIREFQDICKELEVSDIACIGTAVLRRAANGGEFISRLKERFALDCEVISEEKEASLAFKACERDFGSGITCLDIGGGSTEVISKSHTVSMPFGCVTLTEEFLKHDPPKENEVKSLRHRVALSLRKRFDEKETAALSKNELVAVAGTATTLMAIQQGLETYDGDRVHGQTLSREDLTGLISMLAEKTLAERRRIRGLEPKRADVITAGAIVLDEVMRHFRFERAVISDRGVMWGLFYEKFCD